MKQVEDFGQRIARAIEHEIGMSSA